MKNVGVKAGISIITPIGTLSTRLLSGSEIHHDFRQEHRRTKQMNLNYFLYFFASKNTQIIDVIKSRIEAEFLIL